MQEPPLELALKAQIRWVSDPPDSQWVSEISVHLWAWSRQPSFGGSFGLLCGIFRVISRVLVSHHLTKRRDTKLGPRWGLNVDTWRKSASLCRPRLLARPSPSSSVGELGPEDIEKRLTGTDCVWTLSGFLIDDFSPECCWVQSWCTTLKS